MSCRFAEQALPYTVTPVDNLFLAEYMPRATGLQTQVYLYGLFLCHNPGMEAGAGDIARALGVTVREVLEAFAYWQGKGLVRILGDAPLEVEYLCLRLQGYATPPAPRVPGQYYALVEELQRLLAPRTFGASEMRRVQEWLEVYGFAQETVVALVAYCLKCTKGRAGVKYMDTVARAWADANVRTAADAAAYIEEYEERVGGAAAILKRWRLNRRPSEDELALYAKWTQEWGFTRESILAACPALTSATSPSFDYLNGVLKRLYEAGRSDAAGVRGDLALEREQAAFAREVFRAAGIAGSASVAQRAALWAMQEALPREVLLLAAARAQGKKDPYAYLRRVAQRWLAEGIRTPEAARADMEAVPPRRAGKEKPGFDYEQRAYTDEELSRVIVNLEDGE